MKYFLSLVIKYFLSFWFEFPIIRPFAFLVGNDVLSFHVSFRQIISFRECCTTYLIMIMICEGIFK